MLRAFTLADSLRDDFEDSRKGTGIKPAYQPYWQHLPYANIFRSVTSDSLHQLGDIIKHLVKWLTKALGRHEIHTRCHCFPPNHNLWHFAKGTTQL
ncbi:hypothetical protein BC834DRAFT_838746 [Gloeopeniophorella convolvens]|nr:hypothetical protein BC834DRAFT_838746 [Gloeopeniophorella convolvens]